MIADPGSLLAASHPVVAAVDLNPIDWVSVLRYPIGGLIYELSLAFNHVGVLQAIGPFGLAIVIATVLIRGLLVPVFRWNIRTQRRVQRDQRIVAPQVNDIRRRYKGRGQARQMNEEIQKVYAEHGISMFSGLSGCLPLLVQLPVLYGLYWGIQDVIGNEKGITFDRLPAGFPLHFLWIPDVANTIPKQIGTAAGVACKATATTCHTDWANLVSHPANLALLILPILTGLAYFVQSKMTMQPMRADMSDTERQMASSMRMVVYFMPLMSVFFCFIWPQGLTLYWVSAALFMVGQQFLLMGWGSMRLPDWFPGAHRVTELSFVAADFGPASARGGAAGGGGPSATGGGRPPRPRPHGPRAPVSTAPGTGRTPTRAQRRARHRR